jgi:hypothetical protein
MGCATPQPLARPAGFELPELSLGQRYHLFAPGLGGVGLPVRIPRQLYPLIGGLANA